MFDSIPFAYTREKVTKQAQHVLDHQDDYCRMIEDLEDEASKELLARILLFRLTFESDLNVGVKSSYPHYFEGDIFRLENDEVFVDGGGFDGDTLKEFMKQCKGEFQGYYLFEPEEALCKNAMQVSNLRRIHYFQAGLYDENGEISFTVGEGTGNGTVAVDGATKIKTLTVDDCVSGRVSFIKLDVEGSELKALQGARRTIETYTPKLAVCVYHKYEDILELYDCISKLGKYRFFLRAQMDNVDTEITLYAMP